MGGVKLNIRNVILVVFVIGMVVLTGCSGSASSDNSQQYYGGGGCGVAAPNDGDSSDIVQRVNNIDNTQL